MVVALLAHCLKSMGELSVGNDASVAFDIVMHHAVLDCLLPADRPLWEPLGQQCIKYSTRSEGLDEFVSGGIEGSIRDGE